MITDSEYEELYENTLLTIERALDTIEGIDYENNGSILTLYFANRSKIIINRQLPLQQLWIAAKTGGFHLDYDSVSKTWKTDATQGKELQGEEIFMLLSRLCTEQANKPITLQP